MTDVEGMSGAVDRFGVIDIGSNSVRLVVFEGANRSPAYFYNEKVLCGLGLNLAQTGLLNPSGKARALLTLKRFVEITNRMHLTGLRAVATEAVRAATDGLAFCADVLAETGLKIEVITGAQEAELSAKGILLGAPQASGLICDIGGASMELAELDQGQIKAAKTSKLGPMAVMGVFEDAADLNAHIKTEVAALTATFRKEPDVLFLVGGSWRALAQIHMARTDYPLRVLHEYNLSFEEFLPTLKFVESASLEDLQALSDAAERRLSLLPTAARILQDVFLQIRPKRISFSSYGLREGVLFEQMPEELRTLDPLIEAARADELAQARFPGFGDVLYQWVIPLFGDVSPELKRLIHAACLLHDVQWRSHPDYRGDLCFDAATHSNLGGIDHQGRVFLAWCLLHRYKVRKISAAYEDVRRLISDAEFELAKIAGKAIRLGAMMSGADAAHMGHLELRDKELCLILPRSSQELFGEVVQKRLEGLASAMGREACVEYD